VFRLTTPISEADIRKLKVNDTLYLSGTIVTSRDQAHRRALEYAEKNIPLPVNLEGLAVFHCGPIMRKESDRWAVVAAGPTTSSRMEAFEPEFIERFKPRVIIGKGGMGEKTTKAMAKSGAIYAAFTGGAAVLAANVIKRVVNVEWLDLGMPEAMWVLEVNGFGPLVVAIDSFENNLLRDVAAKAQENSLRVFRKLGL
jgi:fumarate hydratase subunit beta